MLGKCPGLLCTPTFFLFLRKALTIVAQADSSGLCALASASVLPPLVFTFIEFWGEVNRREKNSALGTSPYSTEGRPGYGTPLVMLRQ